MHLSTKKAARHGRQVHRSFSGAPSFLRCTEPSQVHRSCPSELKFQWRIEGHSHGRGGGTPRAAQPPAIRFGPYGPSRATLENAFAFPQLRALAGSSQGSGPGRKNGPVAGAITRMVGAVGLETTIPKAEDFKSPAYANSATPPCASKRTTPRCRRAAHGASSRVRRASSNAHGAFNAFNRTAARTWSPHTWNPTAPKRVYGARLC